jgi:hypothetical protein
MRSTVWRRVVGGIGVLWGGALLYQHLTRAAHERFDTAFMAGRVVAYALAGTVFVAGLYLLLRTPRSP